MITSWEKQLQRFCEMVVRRHSSVSSLTSLILYTNGHFEMTIDSPPNHASWTKHVLNCFDDIMVNKSTANMSKANGEYKWFVHFISSPLERDFRMNRVFHTRTLNGFDWNCVRQLSDTRTNAICSYRVYLSRMRMPRNQSACTLEREKRTQNIRKRCRR